MQTTFGSAVHDPHDFLVTFLNGITAAGLYFVVASGFTLIFGLMRVVNMAHGAFFLLGGYVALKLERHLVGQDSAFGMLSSQVSLWQWVVPAITRRRDDWALGLGMQQSFLRWNQGPGAPPGAHHDRDLDHPRRPDDRALRRVHPGHRLARCARPPPAVQVAGVEYSVTRLFILAIAVAVGLALYLWLKKTRTGMVIRAGVDDRQMVSALGVNIQLTFAIAFFVGSALAGLGGAIGGSFASLGPGVDAQLAPLLARRRDHRRHGVAASAPPWARCCSGSSPPSRPCTCPRATPTTRSSLRSRSSRVVLAFRPLGLFGRPA